MPSVYIVNSNDEYNTMFINEGWDVVLDFNEADMIQFTGGADVSPHLYHHLKHPTTHTNFDRDLNEVQYWMCAREYDKKIAGICRGGQFVHVMNNGWLWQDVDKHAINGTHDAWYNDVKYSVTSTHHQMMGSWGDFNVLVIADLSNYKAFGDKTIKGFPPKSDIEAMYYEKTNSLSFQPHPEFVGADNCRELYFTLLRNHLNIGA